MGARSFLALSRDALADAEAWPATNRVFAPHSKLLVRPSASDRVRSHDPEDRSLLHAKRGCNAPAECGSGRGQCCVGQRDLVVGLGEKAAAQTRVARCEPTAQKNPFPPTMIFDNIFDRTSQW